MSSAASLVYSQRARNRLSELGVTPDPEPEDWRGWLEQKFPEAVESGFASFHEEYWNWLWSVEQDNSPPPFIGIWARGAGKSTSAELGAAALGLRGKRKYLLYVRDTQSRADDSVSNIAALLEAHGAERKVNRFNLSKGWKRNRIRTADGFTVDALGLDTAVRGIKLEQQRPDAIFLDDVDARFDSQRTTEKKIAAITEAILPAGSSNAITLGIQNLVIPSGVFSRLADGRADFLQGRIVSGPHPAIRNLKVEKQEQPDGSLRDVVSGELTWNGLDIEACQRIVDRIGLSAFIREAQHSVQEREGALLTRDTFNETRVGKAPELVRVVIGVDPSGGSEEIGIVVCGKGRDGHGYTLADYTVPGRLGPLHWASEVARAYEEYEADKVVAERNFGGDMVASNLRTAAPHLPVKLVTASRGKQVRAEPVATLFEDRRAHHVGGFDGLETEWTSWVPGDPDSPNALDAEVWAMSELMMDSTPEPRVRVFEF